MKPVSPESPSILLASRSPRRLELTKRIGFHPLVRVSAVEEIREEGEAPRDYARRLAGAKARAVADAVEGTDLPGWILSADTIVVHGKAVLEKPTDKEEARAMLARLSGEEHEVITAFCWLWRSPGAPDARVEAVRDLSAKVWMRELSPEMIARYVATGEPMDKAGSYGIQDVGSVLVRRIEGSYFCVVGLPVCEVVETLEELGGLESYPFLSELEEK